MLTKFFFNDDYLFVSSWEGQSLNFCVLLECHFLGMIFEILLASVHDNEAATSPPFCKYLSLLCLVMIPPHLDFLYKKSFFIEVITVHSLLMNQYCEVCQSQNVLNDVFSGHHHHNRGYLGQLALAWTYSYHHLYTTIFIASICLVHHQELLAFSSSPQCHFILFVHSFGCKLSWQHPYFQSLFHY